jgi:hypothetical protein
MKEHGSAVVKNHFLLNFSAKKASLTNKAFYIL